MSDEFHCRHCSTRPRANLTLYDDPKLGRVLARPECLYTIAAMQIVSGPRPPVPEGTKGGVHGLRVVDRPRPTLRRVK